MISDSVRNSSATIFLSMIVPMQNYARNKANDALINMLLIIKVTLKIIQVRIILIKLFSIFSLVTIASL